MRASRTQLREPGLGNSWLVKEQIRSHTKSRTESVRFRFRAEGKEERAEEPTESHLESPFSKILGEPRALEHATCISTRSNPRSQACAAPFPYALPSAPHQAPQGQLQQRNGSDMSIMRESGHWIHSARRTHLPKMGRSALGWIHPRILREAVTRPGMSCASTMQQALLELYCATLP